MLRMLLTLTALTAALSLGVRSARAQSPQVDRCSAAVPSFGLDAVDMTDDLRGFFGVPAGTGVLITSVSGPALAAGLIEGDVIVQVGDRTIYTVADLQDTTRRQLIVYRFGDPYVVDLVNPMAFPDPMAMSCATVMRWRGVGTLELTVGLDRFFGAAADVGVLVDRVTAGQCSDVRVGDVITHVNGTAIRSELDFGSLALGGSVGPLTGQVLRYGEVVEVTWCGE